MSNMHKGLALACVLVTTGQQAQAQYRQINLVSDGFVAARYIDRNLKNPWGIAFNPTGPFWIANNGTGASTVYDGTGQPFPPKNPLVITVPLGKSPLPSSELSKPTGIVFNPEGGFPLRTTVPVLNSSRSSKFIFASEDGTLAGWNPNIDPNNAVVMVEPDLTLPSTSPPAIYKGLALSKWNGATYLYATNFRTATVDVYNSNWRLVGRFTDPQMDRSYAPFGIVAQGNFLYVTYAKRGPDGDDVAGPGNGFVDIFLPNGHFVRRLVSGGKLNSPWGIAFAPQSWGRLGNAILIGNFGDGKINAYHKASGHFLGVVTDSSQDAVEVPGLWGIAFGNGYANSDPNGLYFTSGVGDEEHGLFGVIQRMAQ